MSIQRDGDSHRKAHASGGWRVALAVATHLTITATAQAQFAKQPTPKIICIDCVDFIAAGGDGQRAMVATSLASPISVTLTFKGDGFPAVGERIDFSIISPSGATLSTSSTVTDDRGTASTSLTLGTRSGAYQVIASCPGLVICNSAPVLTFNETALPGPIQLSLLSGDGQTGEVLRTLRDFLAVRVADKFGNPPTTPVAATFSVTSNPPGTQQGATPSTVVGSDTISIVQLTLGDTPGVYNVIASCGICTPSILTFTENAIQIQLLDPVTGDSATSLLSEKGVTTDVSLLRDLKRGIVAKGVAADGVATLVIRVLGMRPSSNLSLTLRSDQDGGLATLDDMNFRAAVSFQADADGSAFLFYRAPDDFGQVNSPANSSDSSRMVHLAFNPNIAENTNIMVVRPPVVLVHGFWGNQGNWDPFVTNLHTLLGNQLPFDLFSAWYNFPLPQVTAVHPALSTSALRAVQRTGDTSSLGFLYNAGLVLPELDLFLTDFKSSNSVAAAQVDIVGHSMGGLVARAFPAMQGYYSTLTLGAGYVHKLITIDTPHLGTPLASRLLSTGAPLGDNTCLREFQAGKGKLAAISVNTALGATDGAVGDFVGDGIGGGFVSPAIPALMNGAPSIPTAFIAGNGCGYFLNSGGGFDPCPFSPLTADVALILGICASTPLVTTLAATQNGSQSGWPSLFLQGPLSTFGGDSDGIVPLTSQLNLRSSTILSLPQFTYPVVHSQGANLLGFTAANSLGDARVAAAVIQLLNTARSTSAQYIELF